MLIKSHIFNTDVPQSKYDDTVKAEDTSVLLAGNLGPLIDKEHLDHSLLDAEDDDDDDFEESTLDQLLQHSLLDSDEEEVIFKPFYSPHKFNKDSEKF